jgi:hypothetical protein
MPKTTSHLTKHVKQDARNSSKEEHIARREGWSAEDIGEESSYEGTTETSRRLRRGDESVGDPDERDVAGATAEKDMPQSRELRRKPHRSSANLRR